MATIVYEYGMSTRAFLALFLMAVTPVAALAHTGGAVDASGCHPDRRNHTYHCHQGEFAGKVFRSRSDMLKMRKTGVDTTIPNPDPGILDDLGGALTGKDKEDLDSAKTDLEDVQRRLDALEGKSAPAPAASETMPAGARAPSGSVAAPPGAAAPGTIESRLGTLQRLYDKGLITESEYQRKRQEIIDSL